MTPFMSVMSALILLSSWGSASLICPENIKNAFDEFQTIVES
ncbi:hypothetical protein PO124_18230 [Bacillus licheniformis]|nr:hypothetical protein [Bacillus licheniformis]